MYTHLSREERESIGLLWAQGHTSSAVGRMMRRNSSTIRRELNRVRPRYLGYSPLRAEDDAREKRLLPRRTRKLDHLPLQRLVHRKLKLCWSPEQIAHHLKRHYPGDTAMQVSHEAIYTYIYVLPRGALRRELISYLRQGRRGRQRRKRSTDARGRIPNIVGIRERPKAVAHRTVPGHWESDLLIGKDHASAIGTLVERTTRTTILVPLRAKDAVTVRKAFARTVKRLPREVFRSITHDRGTEMYEHELFTRDTQVQVYFADPYSPWQRGTNENTNGLIRQFFPKGTDFSRVPHKELKRVQRLLNQRPRETLHWRTPQEVFTQLFQKRAVRV